MSRKSGSLCSKSGYSVHPSVAMVQSVVAKMKEKTGRTLEEWIDIVNKSGPRTDDKRRDWLKQEHKLGTNYASWITERAAGRRAEDGDPQAYLRAAEQYVVKMYAGPKAGLRAIHDRLMSVGLKIAKDVKACPCQTMVPLYRNHVIAQIKPSTNKRIDMGFALGGRKASGKLIDTGGFAKKDRITHRIPIASVDEIDDEISKWLRVAYDLDG